MKKLNVIIGENLLKEFYPRTNEFTDSVIAFPENYEHPKRQVELIEQICIEFNKSNESLYILTNSPYIIDHLSNLMRAYKLGDDRIAEEFLLQNKNAFINPDLVTVSLFKDGEFTNVFDNADKDCLIDWSTFTDVTDKILDVWDKIEMREEELSKENED